MPTIIVHQRCGGAGTAWPAPTPTPLARRRRRGERYSARSRVAVLVPAAMRPGTAATRFASTREPTTMRATVTTGTLGAGTAWISVANRFHRLRPAAMPTGTPTAVAI